MIQNTICFKLEWYSVASQLCKHWVTVSCTKLRNVHGNKYQSVLHCMGNICTMPGIEWLSTDYELLHHFVALNLSSCNGVQSHS